MAIVIVIEPLQVQHPVDGMVSLGVRERSPDYVSVFAQEQRRLVKSCQIAALV
jgi:hypothetical protein